MSELEELGRRAIADPIRKPPLVATLKSVAARRQRHRRSVGVAVAVLVVGAIGYSATIVASGDSPTRVETASDEATRDQVAPPQDASPTGDRSNDEGLTAEEAEAVAPSQDAAPTTGWPNDEGLTAEEAEAVAPRVLRETETLLGAPSTASVVWRLAEYGTPSARCLAVTAVVAGAIHSRGESCHLFSNPSSQAWDLEIPLRFELAGQAFVVLFGRAGDDVSSIRLSDPLPAVDADVDGAWLLAAPTPDDGVPYEILIEAFDSADMPLLAERVPVDPVDAVPLDAEMLASELRIGGATVAAFEESGGAGSPMFSGTARPLCVSGEQLRIYEYDTIEERLAESDMITIDGQLSGPGTAVIVSWIGPPRFFAGGRVIVLTVSGDTETADLLADVFGPTLSPDGAGPRGTGDLVCD